MRRQGRPIPLLRRVFSMKPVPGLAEVFARALHERGDTLRREGRDREADSLLAEAAALEPKPSTAAAPPVRPLGTTSK
jgi:hypothetical protein